MGAALNIQAIARTIHILNAFSELYPPSFAVTDPPPIAPKTGPVMLMMANQV